MMPLGATALYVNDMAPALWRAALAYGIDPVVMLAQAAHETGWGAFPGKVPPSFCNTCGLKINETVRKQFPDCAGGDLPLAHAQFASWDAGAHAHAQHLLAYCQVALPLGTILLDPRWVHVYGKRPAISTVEELGGLWAPSVTYGQALVTLAGRLAA